MTTNPRLIDLSGQRFGEWTVTTQSGNRPGGAALWRCVCTCGTIKAVTGSDLRAGKSISCGCKGSRATIGHRTRTHGATAEGKSKLYNAWINMRARCRSPSSDRFKHYGGRGITVCDEWGAFDTFSAWAKQAGYAEGLTIERIDVNGNYCPENCTWIPRAAQARNKTNNQRNAEGRPWIDIAAEHGISDKVFCNRVAAGGWPPSVAATWPKGKRRANRARNDAGQWVTCPSMWRR